MASPVDGEEECIVMATGTSRGGTYSETSKKYRGGLAWLPASGVRMVLPS